LSEAGGATEIMGEVIINRFSPAAPIKAARSQQIKGEQITSSLRCSIAGLENFPQLLYFISLGAET